MAYYLKGIGDAPTRQNEILPSLDARINKFLCGHTAGIIKGELNEFAAETIDRGVRIRSGFCQAYGFFGCADTDTQINFVMPASGARYTNIYAEIDLSVVPNKFEIKAREVSNSSAWTARQDNLLNVQSGKYQLHLYAVYLTPTTVTLSDYRTFIAKPLQAVNAELASVAATASGLSAELNAQIDGTYCKVRSLKVSGTTYGSVDVGSGGVYFPMQPPDASAAYLILQGTLQCANTYSVQLFIDLVKTNSLPQLIWIRSVNGQVNTSYGFISMEASRSGNQIFLLVYKINQYNNNYGDSHAYASGCKFQVTDILEVTNTKK